MEQPPVILLPVHFSLDGAFDTLKILSRFLKKTRLTWCNECQLAATREIFLDGMCPVDL